MVRKLILYNIYFAFALYFYTIELSNS